MVSRKSTKVSKSTYTERVLSAFSQASKEHRRNAIHIATLRAQVRKNAQAKNDTLGPQWSNWVGRAVHKLEDESILEHAKSSGNVSLTPDAKKAITAARRHLSLSKNAFPTPAQEDVIWKFVTDKAVGSSKRKQDDGEGDGDEDILSHRSSKRAKSTGTGNKKALARMTKAELIAELASLQREKNSDIQAADTQELQRQLHQRQQEIDAVRGELEDIKHRTAITFERGMSETGSLNAHSRYVTPEPITSSPNRADAVAPALGITRTQSGSFISAISKRPTPAPSSPTGSERHVYFTSRDVFGVGDENADTHDTQTFLATPDTTPVRAAGTVSKEIELGNEVEKYKALYEQLSEANEISDQKIKSLEQALISRGPVVDNSDTEMGHGGDSDAQLSILQAQSERFQEQNIEKEGLVRELERERDLLVNENQQRAGELAHAQESLKESEQTAARHLAGLQAANVHLKELQTALDSDRADLDSERTSSAILRKDQEQLESEVRKLNEYTSSSRGEVETLSKKVAELQQTVEHCKFLQTTSANDLTQTSRRLAVADASNASLSDELMVAEEDISKANKQLDDALASIKALNAQLATSDKHLGESRSSEGALKEQLSQTQQDAEELRTRILSLESSAESLNGRLKSSSIAAEELQKKIIEYVELNKTLASDLAAKEKLISDLEAAKDEALKVSAEEGRQNTERILTLEKALHDTDGALTQCTKETERLTQVAAEKERILEDLVVKLTAAEATERSLRNHALEQQEATDSLNSELANVKASVKNGEAALDETKRFLVSETVKYNTTISSLQNSVSLAESQLDTLGANNSEIKSRLEETRTMLTTTQAGWEADRVRISALEDERLHATERAQDAEESVSQLLTSKKADETTIEDLKAAFSGLRKDQLASWADFDTKVASAQSSFIPQNRQSV